MQYMYNIYQCLRETKALSISTRLWSYQSVIWNPHKIKKNCDNKLDMVYGKAVRIEYNEPTVSLNGNHWFCPHCVSTKHMSSTCDEKIVYQLTDIKSRNSNYLSEKKNITILKHNITLYWKLLFPDRIMIWNLLPPNSAS